MISHPTQHIAAVPMAVRNVNTLGIGKTMFRPILRRSALPACEVQSDVIHLHKKGYDPINQNRDKDADGRSFPVRRTLSLVDDIFPNLQMGSEVPGEWTHVNSGLFRPQIFATLGGFSDCIEEDREFRNRIILSGEIVWIIPDLLLTKYETEGALTQDSRTDYDSARRRADPLRGLAADRDLAVRPQRRALPRGPAAPTDRLGHQSRRSCPVGRPCDAADPGMDRGLSEGWFRGRPWLSRGCCSSIPARGLRAGAGHGGLHRGGRSDRTLCPAAQRTNVTVMGWMLAAACTPLPCWTIRAATISAPIWRVAEVMVVTVDYRQPPFISLSTS